MDYDENDGDYDYDCGHKHNIKSLKLFRQQSSTTNFDNLNISTQNNIVLFDEETHRDLRKSIIKTYSHDRATENRDSLFSQKSANLLNQ